MQKKLLPITDFAQQGLNTDALPWDLPPGAFTDIHNIRMIRGKLTPFGGYTELLELPEQVKPGYLMFVDTPSANFWIVPCRSEVLVHDGNGWSDISRDGMPNVSDEDLWHGCFLSRIPILNHPEDFPQYWQPQAVSQPLVSLPFLGDGTTWQERGERCRIMRSHKQFLIAMDCFSITYGEVADGVRWSTPADIGGVPASWDAADPTNTAGFTQLGGAGGSIIDGLSLRDAFVVYRERGISVMDYMPNSPYVFRIRHLSTTFGLASPDSIVEVNGLHYFLADGDIMYNDGNKVDSLIHGKIKKKFLADFNAEYYKNSFVVKNSIASEVWFCTPRRGSTHPDVAYIYNWRDNSWGYREIPTSPFADYGAKSTPQLTWESIPGVWDASSLLWGVREVSPLDDTVVCVVKPESADNPSIRGQLRVLDVGPETATQYVSTAERVGFALEGLAKTTTITSVYPHANGPGGFYIRLGSMDHPGAPIRWKERVWYQPGQMRKVDIRTTGELHCFQIQDELADASWEISGMDVEYVEAGLR